MRKWEIEKKKWEYYKKFGASVAKARKAKGLSQVALAEKVGMKRPFLAKIEQGRSALLLHVGETLKKALSLAVLLSIAGCAKPEAWGPIERRAYEERIAVCKQENQVLATQVKDLQEQLASQQRKKIAVE